MLIIRGRRAIVTGAASGIGKAIALALAAEGADLFLIDLDTVRMESVVREASRHGVEVIAAGCDLAIPAEINRVISEVRTTWADRIHILVNCAGIAFYGPFHLATEAEWRQVIAVNLLAPMQIIHELLPALVSAEQAHILNVCSLAGLMPMRKLSPYQASKYGLVGFTLALRNDYQRDNFGVTALCPGFVTTPMLANMKDPEPHRKPPAVPDFMCTEPELVAATAIDAIRRDRRLVVVSIPVRLAWWAIRQFPALSDWIIREGWRRRGKIVLPGREERGPGRSE